VSAVDVYGGAYHEIVRDQGVRQLMGSGLRGAAVLASLGVSTRLVTRVEEQAWEEATAICAAHGVEPTLAGRQGPVTFDYATSLAEPVVRAPFPADVRGGAEAMRPEGEPSPAAVLFGMVEGPVEIAAERLVVDPQHASLDETGFDRATVDRAALVANSHEIGRLSGRRDVHDAATWMIGAGFETVVVKCGALGALVVEGGGVATWIAPHVTEHVASLGTGDVFTAAFARVWTSGGSPVQAATTAAAATAWYAVTGVPDVADASTGTAPPASSPGNWGGLARPKVYLAAPFFAAGQIWFVETARRGLTDIGADVFSPLHDVAQGGSSVAIATADLAGLRSCDAVLALLDGADPGTEFECGYATALGIPVVGVVQKAHDDELLMVRGSGTAVFRDLATGAYNAVWAGLNRQEFPDG
jgi:hypothetical protein